MDPIAEIKRLYYATTRATIERDLAHAIGLLKTLETEEARERVAVYMDGLSQMRSEWEVKPSAATAGPAGSGAKRPGAGRVQKRAR
jgi:hypothetical protein